MSDQEKALKEAYDSIIQQQGDCSDEDVFVIELMSIRFEKFDNKIKQKLERFTSLQMLTINDCLLSDLTNFPHIPSLIRLDLVFNRITGDQLYYLRGSRHLQALMLGANRIEDIDDISKLGQMRELLQLDLLNNPVVNTDNYRTIMFKTFPSLHILDTLDRNGIDQEKASLDVSASRIPKNLFDTSKSDSNSTSLFSKAAPSKKVSASNAFSNSAAAPVKQPAQKVVQAKAPVQAQKVQQQQATSVPRRAPTSRTGGVGKSGKMSVAYSKQSTSQKSGLIFPCGRLRRYLKQACKEFRISSSSNIYLAGVLEYLAAEVLETAGNIAKNNRQHRITPLHLRDAFRNDSELNQLVQGSIVSQGGSTSTNFVIPVLNKNK